MNKKELILKIGTGKFIYGEGTISHLEEEIKHFGGNAIIIGGPTSVSTVLDKLDHTDNLTVCSHTENCSKSWAHRYADMAHSQSCTVIVAVGGGKCIDLAKCASVYANLPIITVPTSIATCVASSAVCIMYDDKGVPDGSVPMEREVDVVIADTDLIKSAPKRLLASGMVDSLAKLPEVIHNMDIENYTDCDLSKYICMVNAKVIWDFIMGEGLNLYDNLSRSKQWDDMILTNLLHTSLVSGFSAGSGQLALAHGLYDFTRKTFTNQTKDILHGEIVGVGLIMQLVYNQENTNAAKELIAFMKKMEMPTDLPSIHFDVNDLTIHKLTEYLINSTDAYDTKRLRKAIDFISSDLY